MIIGGGHDTLIWGKNYFPVRSILSRGIFFALWSGHFSNFFQGHLREKIFMEKIFIKMIRYVNIKITRYRHFLWNNFQNENV